MEPASGRRLHKTWGLAGRHIFESGCVFGIRIGNRREERPRVRMKGIIYELVDCRFLDDLSGIHNEDTLGKVADRRQVVGDINNSQVVGA